jgi:hypothetical protein
MNARILQRLSIAGVVAVFAVLVVVAFAPNFIRARTDTSRNPCINSLRCIDGATQQWALDNGKTSNDTPTWDGIRPYLSKDGKIPRCRQTSLAVPAR